MKKIQGTLTAEKYHRKIFSFICKISEMSEHHKCQNINYINITDINQLNEIWMYVFKVYMLLLPEKDSIEFLKNVEDNGLLLVAQNIRIWLANITSSERQQFM